MKWKCKKKQQSKTERGREKAKRRSDRGKQSRRGDKTNHISIKMRKAFCGCRCLHSLLPAPLPISLFLLFLLLPYCTPCCLHRCFLSALCMQHATFSVALCLVYAPVSLSVSLFIARPLLALHFACKKHNNQGR